MDNKRAKEIASSPDMINVTYLGNPIYIESVDYYSDTARIHLLDQPNNRQEVAIKNLVEQ